MGPRDYVVLCLALLVLAVNSSYINVYTEQLNINFTHASPNVSIAGVYNNGTVFPDKYIFTLNSLLEIDLNGTAVSTVVVSQDTKDYDILQTMYLLDHGTNPVQEVNMKNVLTNGAHVAWIFQVIEKPTIIEWGNMSIHTQPFSAKFSSILTNWPWKSASNRLAFEVSFHFPRPLVSIPAVNLSSSQFTVTFNTSSSWLTFNSPAVLDFDGVFHPFDIVPTPILSDTFGVIGLSLRFIAPIQFKTLTFDPDFSVLIANDNTRKNIQSKSKFGLIIGVVLGSFGLAVLVTVIFLGTYLKKRRASRDLLRRQMTPTTSSDSPTD